MDNEYSEQQHRKHEGGEVAPEVLLEQAQAQYLRVWTDVYFPRIAELAIENDPNAIMLLIYCVRPVYMTPPPVESGIADYWNCMIALADKVRQA